MGAEGSGFEQGFGRVLGGVWEGSRSMHGGFEAGAWRVFGSFLEMFNLAECVYGIREV